MLIRHDSSHPSDEDLSPGTPESRALIQSFGFGEQHNALAEASIQAPFEGPKIIKPPPLPEDIYTKGARRPPRIKPAARPVISSRQRLSRSCIKSAAVHGAGGWSAMLAVGSAMQHGQEAKGASKLMRTIESSGDS